jgi:hypothetical protein
MKLAKENETRVWESWTFLGVEAPLWFLGFLSVALFFPSLGSRDFWAPVEPRYAEIARVMLTRGEWIIPKVNGDLYTDKPMLYFWSVLLLSKLAGGVNEWTVRLPSALSALGLVLATYFLGRDLFNSKVGFMAAAVLATCARVLWEARWAHTDMLFSFFFTLSLYFFCRALFHKGVQREFLLAYGLMALATLTKGLMGIVLPGLIVLVFVTLKWEWRSILEWRIPSGALVFLLVAVPWYVLVTLATGGKWLEEFVLIHHIQNYTTSFGHRKPFSYYFLNFPLDFLPWTIFVVPAIFTYRSKVKCLNEPAPLFLFLWFFVIFFFFSFAKTKRALYLLPLFPPAALFVAHYFDDLIRGTFSQGTLYQWLAQIFFNLLWISGLSLPLIAWFLQREALWISLPFAIIMVGCGLMASVSIWRGLPSMTFFLTVFTVLIAMLYSAIWILPFIDQYKSAKPFALQVKKTVPSVKVLYIYADTMNDFNFYTEREIIPILSSREDVENVVSREKTVYLLVRERDLKRVNVEGTATALATGNVGDKKWYLLQLSKQGERS